MKRTRAFLLLLIIMLSFCFFILAPSVYATTYENDGFENYNTKSWWTVGNNGTVYPIKTAEQHHAGSYSIVTNTTGAGYGYCYNNTASTISTNFHYEIWIYLPSGVPLFNGTLVSEAYDGSAVDFRTGIVSNGASYSLYVGDPTAMTETNVTTISSNSWHEIDEYYLRSLGRLDIYVDSVNQSSGTWNNGVIATASVTRFYLGDPSGANTQYDGKMFYDDLLTDTQAEPAVPDISPPTFGTPATNSTEPGTVCNFTVTVSDNVAVWKTILGTNLSGTWTNDSTLFTWANYTSVLANVTVTLPTSVGAYGYQWYAEDNSTNNATTGIVIIQVGLIDSYSETNQNDYKTINGLQGASSAYTDAGNVFTSLSTTHNVTLVKLYLCKHGSPTGTAHAVIYAVSGSAGNQIPTGAALATSDGFDVSTLTTSFQLISFTFSSTYTLSANTKYGVDYQSPSSGTIDSSNYVEVGFDDLHDHNNMFYYYNAWTALGGAAVCFYVYGYYSTATNGIQKSYSFADVIVLGSTLQSGLERGFKNSDTLALSSLTNPLGLERGFTFSDSLTLSSAIVKAVSVGFSFSDRIILNGLTKPLGIEKGFSISDVLTLSSLFNSTFQKLLGINFAFVFSDVITLSGSFLSPNPVSVRSIILMVGVCVAGIVVACSLLSVLRRKKEEDDVEQDS